MTSPNFGVSFTPSLCHASLQKNPLLSIIQHDSFYLPPQKWKTMITIIFQKMHKEIKINVHIINKMNKNANKIDK